MAGGLLQLVAYGTQNIFLNANPSLTFFKQVYKPYTNFAMESIRLEFNRRDANVYETTKLVCKVSRYADLITQMYLVFELPDVNISNGTRMKWAKRLGETLIDNYYISIGGTIVDKQYGEWLYLWRELSNETSKLHLYNKMIGNTPDVFAPDVLRDSIAAKPFIKGRKLVVPLDFWFNKHVGTALPLVSLQYHDVYLNVELRQLQDVFLVDEGDTRGYRRPESGNPNHSIKNFVPSGIASNSSMELNPYLEVNYIFLDSEERDKFTSGSLEYLVEQTTRVEAQNVSGSQFIDLQLQNPVKELVFITRDPSARTVNDWTTFVDTLTGDQLLASAKIMFNGRDRIEEKTMDYFMLLQPWQHHTASPPDGVSVYSFSLHPEHFQPSGSCNMSRINNVQLHVTTASKKKCDIVVYSRNYNFFRVAAGMGGLAFSL